MYTMIPDTAARHAALTAGDHTGNRNAMAINAPATSASPDSVESQNARRRLPVAC